MPLVPRATSKLFRELYGYSFGEPSPMLGWNFKTKLCRCMCRCVCMFLCLGSHTFVGICRPCFFETESFIHTQNTAIKSSQLATQCQGSALPLSPTMRAQVCATSIGFSRGCSVLSSDSCAYAAITLWTEPSPQPLW